MGAGRGTCSNRSSCFVERRPRSGWRDELNPSIDSGPFVGEEDEEWNGGKEGRDLKLDLWGERGEVDGGNFRIEIFSCGEF